MGTVIRLILMAIWTIFWIIIPVLLIPITFRRNLPLWTAHWFWAPVMMKIGGVKLEIQGKEHIDVSTPKIYASNHQSWIDIACQVKAIPTPLYFIGKKELKWFPFLGQFGLIVGFIFIDRGNRDKSDLSMDKAAEMIRKGKSIISFPEGTRTFDGTIGNAKMGMIAMAKQAGVPLAPLAIKGGFEYWSKHKVKLNPGKITVKFGEPIDTTKYDNLEEIRDIYQKRITELYNSI